MAVEAIRHALVLAGRRRTGDDLAARVGVTHKALLPVAGEPMAARVIRALAAQPGLQRIAISCDDSEVFARLNDASKAALATVRLERHESASSPAASVASFLASLPDGEQAIVTTGDHALLRADIVQAFAQTAAQRTATSRGAALVAGAVTESTYRTRFPAGRRTFVRLADVAFSGANLFLAKAPHAARVAEFWVALEGVRKQPWRLVSHFGLPTLVRFLTGRLTLEGALLAVSRAVGAKVDVVFLPQAEAALDVDREADLAAAAAILQPGEGAVEKRAGAS
jgi:molybdopterin-guanine dinucleotide biosynthesis protein A